MVNVYRRQNIYKMAGVAESNAVSEFDGKLGNNICARVQCELGQNTDKIAYRLPKQALHC